MKSFVRKGVRTTLVIALLCWGGFEYASYLIMQEAIERIRSAGFADDVRVEVGGAWTIDVSGLTLKEPLTAGSYTISVRTDSVRILIDPWALARPGLPLAGSIEVGGVHIKLGLAPPGKHHAGAVARTPNARDIQREIANRMTRYCPAKCRFDLHDVTIQADLPGLSMDAYDQLHGELNVHGDGSLSMALQGTEQLGIALHVDFADDALNHTLNIHHPKPIALALQEADLGATIPDVSTLPLQRLEARLERLTVQAGHVHLLDLNVRMIRDPQHWASLRLDSVRTDLVELIAKGLRHTVVDVAGLEATLYRERERMASLNIGHIILGANDVLFGCADRLVCPQEVEDLAFWLRSPSNAGRTVSGSAKRLASCGPQCNRAEDLTFESHGDQGSAIIELEALEAEWSARTRVPGRIEATGGHVLLSSPSFAPLLRKMGVLEDETNPSPKPASVALAPKAIASKTISKHRTKRRKWRRKKRKKYPDLAKVFRQIAADGDQRFVGLLTQAFALVDRWHRVTRADTPKVVLNNIKIKVQQSPSLDPVVDAQIAHLGVASVADGPLNVWGDVQCTLPKRYQRPPETLLRPKREADPDLKVSDPTLQISLNAHVERNNRVALTLRTRTPRLHLSHGKIASDWIDFAPASISAAVVRQGVGTQSVQWSLEHLSVEADAGGVAEMTAKLKLDNSEQGGFLQTTMAIPKQDCGRLHRSIPTAMLVGLQDAEFKGQAKIALTMTTPLNSINTLGIDFDADFSDCRAETLGPRYDVAALNRDDTVFEVHDPKLSKPVQVGPGSRSWTRHIPRHIIGSALATEDGAFFSHQGFSTTRLVRGFRLNLRTRRYLYGGSSITQQLVKNIFLRRTKTLARKLEEAVLVWQVERHVPKERIIRLYLNCIEFGPNLYGIGRAAYAYFKTVPSGLKPIEAAYIMNIKPSPRLGYGLFKRGALTDFWRERSQMIKRKLLRSGRITQEQADEMTPESLYDRFKPKEEIEEKKEKKKPEEWTGREQKA